MENSIKTPKLPREMFSVYGLVAAQPISVLLVWASLLVFISVQALVRPRTTL